MTVTQLRDAAREAIAQGGGRGFVRFATAGEALLVTDAPRHGAFDETPLCRAGFLCRAQGPLLALTPGDALLRELCARPNAQVQIDWETPLHPAQALAARLLRHAGVPLTDEGRQLIVETARLLWLPKERVLAALPGLQASVAAMLRRRAESGLLQTGALLANWCDEQRKDGMNR